MSTVALPERIGERFERLAAKWTSEYRFLSNTARFAMLDSCQRIIGLGDPAVPVTRRPTKSQSQQGQ